MTTPTDYAAEELAVWQEALRAQKRSEQALAHGRGEGTVAEVLELVARTKVLAHRAALLLARAVRVKRAFQHEDTARVWVSSTQAAPLDHDRHQ